MLAYAAIVGILVVALVFYTPRALSHVAWSVRIRRAYKVEGEAWHRYISYSHDTTDGAKIAHRLRTGPLPPMLRHRPLPDQCDFWVRVRLRRRLDASPFVSLVAYFLKAARRRELLTGVLVGTRGTLDEAERFTTEGCYVRTAYVQCDGRDSVQCIARAHSESIAAIRDSARPCDTLAERARMLRCHYVFNKWMLDRVVRDDGKVLRLHRGGLRTSLRTLLSVQMPLDVKCVDEGDGVWVMMATPLWMTLRHA